MDASEIDWETINANLPYEHSEESHAQRRWNPHVKGIVHNFFIFGQISYFE